MRRWVIAWGVAFAAAGAPRGVSAQDPAGIVLNRELASAVPQLRRKISLELKGASIDAALRAVSRRADLPITYNDAILPADRKVWLTDDDIRTDRALEEILKNSGLRLLALKTGQVVVVRDKDGRVGREYPDSVATVMGRVVVGETGASIVGVVVAIAISSDTVLQATTSDSGTFAIANVPWGQHTVTVRYIGYRPLTKKVTVDSAVVHVRLALDRQAVALTELVTTATGQQRRRDIGNAITTINADSVLRTAPIRNLTDLLANRVPGLSVQHTSGAPGDPARLRLRGIKSVMRGNDPVVVVDGIRVYAAQSDVRSGNLTNAVTGGSVAAPSPLDQIDPAIIEKIDVLKGPSAATLYGADAANGVIVITTKRGKPGPTRWDARLSYGRTVPAGEYPVGYYRWGHNVLNGTFDYCPVVSSTCEMDSLVRYQALNDPAMTILGRGRLAKFSLGASGGSQALTYSVTGAYSDETGLLKLPEYEIDRFQMQFNHEPPDWMRQPHHLKKWTVMSNVRALLGPAADVTLTATLGREEQTRTSLETQQASLADKYPIKSTGVWLEPSRVSGGVYTYNKWLSFSTIPYSPFGEYYNHITASTISFTTGLSANWHPRSWLSAMGHAGLNTMPRDDGQYIPSGLASATDSGRLARGLGRSLVGTFDLQSTVRRPLRWGFVFLTNVGANVVTTVTNDVATQARGLVPGTSSLSGATHFDATDARVNTSVFGWYIEPQITGQRLSLSTGLRLDGGSTYGTRLTRTGGGLFGGLLGLPKLNGSWVISEEPWFPFQSLFSSLRLRGTYGQAQVQPGATDRLRLYARRLDGTGELLDLDKLGNTELRPERSTEFEGGFDADVLGSRLSIEFTAYRQMQVDALMPVDLPSSVNGGGSVIRNIGNIRNTGVEIVTTMTPVRTPLVTWTARLLYDRNRNTLTKLGAGVDPNPLQGFVAGYPVGSRWSRPILGAADRNSDGAITADEVQIGDSLVFMGRLYPAYKTAMSSDLSFFGGAVRVSASFSYNAGQTQVNETAKQLWILNPALANRTTPPLQQAAIAVYDSTDYGLTQTVSTFRFETLALSYQAPTSVTRLLHAQELTLSLVGGNLGLHSSYRGKDPDVSAWSPTERIVDTGQLAQPRTWQLDLILRY